MRALMCNAYVSVFVLWISGLREVFFYLLFEVLTVKLKYVCQAHPLLSTK